MLDHISIGVSDLATSMAFYDGLLGPLGYQRVWSDSDAAGYGLPDTDEPFAIKQDPSVNTASNGRFHIAFKADTHDAVRQFYDNALLLGAKADGEPDFHPIYGDGYFASFVHDPDGYRLEAVCHDA